MIWRVLLLVLVLGLTLPASAQLGLPAGIGQLTPAPSGGGCSNSLDFSDACNSANLAVIL